MVLFDEVDKLLVVLNELVDKVLKLSCDSLRLLQDAKSMTADKINKTLMNDINFFIVIHLPYLEALFLS